ncbi:hypothetical protein BJ165DRAFT_1591247 [Panaeolus papilionaceus]|nr:hypothetical protein BJ165DRAFT_1591247 [Panaeolus papilionaceus]
MTISFKSIPPGDVVLTLDNLKVLKNTVIGNPQAKKQLASDILLVQRLIECLNLNREDGYDKTHLDATRTEAAHVVASIGYSSSPTLSTLLRTSALRSLLYAISRFTPADSITLRAAFSRALRVLASSVADVVGPSQWGLQVEELDGSLRAQAKDALDGLLQLEALDIYLPLLAIGSGSHAIITSTAYMISSIIRSPVHRRLMTEWVPPHERQREIKSRRGWEKAAAVGGPGAGIPWVAKRLLDVVLMAPQGDAKVIEAALLALSSLAKENPPIASFIAKSADRESVPPLANILAFTRSKSVDVQLAACLCIAHTLRAFPSHGSLSNAIYSSHYSSHPAHTGQTHAASPRAFWAHGDPYQLSASGREPGVHPTASTWAPWGTSPHTSALTGSMGASLASPLSPGAGPSYAHAPAPGSLHPALPHLGSLPLEENCVRAVINVVNRILVSGVPTDTYVIQSASLGAGNRNGAGGVNRGGAQGAVGESGGLGPAPKSTKVVDSPVIRTKACFLLHYLVADDVSLCHTAMDRGCVENLANLLWFINPPDAGTNPEWEEDEPESISALREGVLTVLASLALAVDEIRKRISDELKLLPCIARALRCRTYPPPSPSTSSSSLTPTPSSLSSASQPTSSSSSSLTPAQPARFARKYTKHVGAKYAACQVLRAITRTVAIMRTTVSDCGLGMDLLRIVMDEEVGVTGAGMGAANLNGTGGMHGAASAGPGGVGLMGRGAGGVERASGRAGTQPSKGKEPSAKGDGMDVEGSKGEVRKPMKEDRRVVSAALAAVYLEEKLVPRLVYFLKESADPSLRLNALWAIKNLVRNTSLETKKDIMRVMKWEELLKLLSDPDEDIQDQAFNILRNMCDNADSVHLVVSSLPTHGLMSAIHAALQLPPTSPTLLNASYLLSNLANGNDDAQDAIMRHPGMLSAIREALAEGGTNVRRALVQAIGELVRSDMRRRREFREVGIVGTLKRVCEFPAGMPSSSSASGGGGRRGVSGERGGVVIGAGGMTRGYSGGGDAYAGMGISSSLASREPVDIGGGNAGVSMSLGSGGMTGRGRLGGSGSASGGGGGSREGFGVGSVGAMASGSAGGGYDYPHAHAPIHGHGVYPHSSHNAGIASALMGGDDKDVVDAARVVLGWFEIHREGHV